MENDLILSICELNKFMKACGIKARELSDGSFEVWLDMGEFHQNPYGFAHGGILYTLADCGAGMTARKYIEFPVTVSSDMHFFSNVREGRIYGRFKIAHGGRTIAVISVTIYSGNDKKLAEGTFTFYNDKRKSYEQVKELNKIRNDKND